MIGIVLWLCEGRLGLYGRTIIVVVTVRVKVEVRVMLGSKVGLGLGLGFGLVMFSFLVIFSVQEPCKHSKDI